MQNIGVTKFGMISANMWTIISSLDALHSASNQIYTK